MENEAKVGENSGVDQAGAKPPDQHSAVDGGHDDMPTPAKRTTAPAFQFYPKDFLTSPRVMAMTPTERGIYITLLCYCWLEGGLSDDVNLLARLAGVPVKQFARVWPHNLESCFRLARNGWRVNERLEVERKKQAAFHHRQAENGSKGGRPKKTHSKPSGLQNQNPLETHSKARALKTEEADRDVLSSEGVQGEIEDFDGQAEFLRFQMRYPACGRKGGRMLMEAYLDAARKVGPARLMTALENHIASEQWSNPKYIPGIDKWFESEQWRQEKPAAGAASASRANPKTAGNIPALQRFIERGRTA